MTVQYPSTHYGSVCVNNCSYTRNGKQRNDSKMKKMLSLTFFFLRLIFLMIQKWFVLSIIDFLHETDTREDTNSLLFVPGVNMIYVTVKDKKKVNNADPTSTLHPQFYVFYKIINYVHLYIV